MTLLMSEPANQSAAAEAAELAEQAAHEARVAQAMADARAATALPGYWPAWAALVLALTGAASHFSPWGFAPGPSTATAEVTTCTIQTSSTPSR
jgi:hypothetical protein